MQKELLQRARKNRLAALEALAVCKENNIFCFDDASTRREVQAAKLCFVSTRTRSAAAETKPAPLLLVA